MIADLTVLLLLALFFQFVDVCGGSDKVIPTGTGERRAAPYAFTTAMG